MIDKKVDNESDNVCVLFKSSRRRLDRYSKLQNSLCQSWPLHFCGENAIKLETIKNCEIGDKFNE